MDTTHAQRGASQRSDDVMIDDRDRRPGAAPAAESGGLRARDVVAFGHEYGRVLSDGRIVGRAEPFAKVFASSRTVKRAVGAVAWVILEDIALDAGPDEHGRLVSDTSVRQIAANLGMNKDTVTRHLGQLRDYGFVLHEEARDHGSGRWQSSRYVLDPSACVERFTHTPTTRPAQERPCPKNPDTAAVDSVSASTGHGDTGSGDAGGLYRHRYANPERQHAGDDRTELDALAGRLREVSVSAAVADDLVARFPAPRIADALAVLPTRHATNPAGWLVRAISEDWQLHDEAQRIRTAHARHERQRADAHDAAMRQQRRNQRLAGWVTAVSAALPDAQLATVVERVARPVAGIGRRSAPVAVSQILAWAIHASAAYPDLTLAAALEQALQHTDGALPIELPTDIPDPPNHADSDDVAGLRQRVSHAIAALELDATRAHAEPG